ncbi:DEAD/DEAH box helicase [Paenibacillus sp. GCM10027626]|uniref:DEAD/DEAH box helicase n=1 Tax=Paenibacillus sp. GCM10027626 TaxID=3273411 RepID=UPI0036400A00
MAASWNEYNLNPALMDKLEQEHITAPTPVQAAALPGLLGGKDISARSQTGTGKTLAYLLPALQMIDTARQELQVLIMAPTQELAMQIVRVAEDYGQAVGVRVQQLIGGASMKRQVEKLRAHPHLICGTPGRIHEIVKTGKLKLHTIRLLIVDEADQVFSLGSTKETDFLVKSMPRDRQLAFFSATRPQAMEEVEGRWMNEPQHIDLSDDQSLKGKVDHIYIVCDKRDKVDTARKLIRMLNPDRALLFINSTDEIANYEAKFGYEGFTIEALYGDADKQRRAATLARFRDGRCQLLLATDVAARGLDIAGLPLVVHLDPAADSDHYIHRSGRTGRMGKSGTVVSIVTAPEKFIMEKFQKQLGIEIAERSMYLGQLWAPEQREEMPQGRKPKSGNNSASKQESLSGKLQVAGRPAAAGGKPAKAAAAPAKAVRNRERDRDRKNKGAPKWLKAKRDGQ